MTHLAEIVKPEIREEVVTPQLRWHWMGPGDRVLQQLWKIKRCFADGYVVEDEEWRDVPTD